MVWYNISIKKLFPFTMKSKCWSRDFFEDGNSVDEDAISMLLIDNKTQSFLYLKCVYMNDFRGCMYCMYLVHPIRIGNRVNGDRKRNRRMEGRRVGCRLVSGLLMNDCNSCNSSRGSLTLWHSAETLSFSLTWYLVLRVYTFFFCLFNLCTGTLGGEYCMGCRALPALQQASRGVVVYLLERERERLLGKQTLENLSDKTFHQVKQRRRIMYNRQVNRQFTVHRQTER